MGSILKVAGKALAFGLLGLIVVPLVVGFGVLILAHIFDPRCGTPGDSGGCEMGAAGIGFFSAVPGFCLGVAWSLFQSYRKRPKT